MPEALAAVPTLKIIPADNSSEMESSAANTDRSSDSRNEDQQLTESNKGRALQTHSTTKSRKSYGRRCQKKTSKTLTSEKTATGALKIKSNLPRALAQTTPSKSLAKYPNLAVTNSSGLNQGHSQHLVIFRQRKSVTQMDFSQALRQINNPDNNANSKVSVRDRYDAMALTYSNDSFVHKVYNKECYIPLPKNDGSQMAGLRIFAMIMLNAWRRRRDEVRRLMEEIADLKRANIRTKTQLHVFNSLFRVEQKRNDELNGRLRSSLDDINVTKSSCEGLTTSLISLKADKALLEQQLSLKEQEYETVNTLLGQTKADLLQSMTLQKELKDLLAEEQKKIQILENQRKELINEVCDLNSEAKQTQDELYEEIEAKNEEIAQIKEALDAVEDEIKAINQATEQQLNANKNREKQLKENLAALEKELKIVQECLEATIGNRLKNYWNNSLVYQEVALNLCHWLVHCVLPAMPPPKAMPLPFSLSFSKVLGIIRR